MGTPFYMSPEQASADRDPSPASDVYSLGCVLYEMLVGEPPYTGGSAQAVLAKILTEDPRSATVVRPSIPANVDAAIRKALESNSGGIVAAIVLFGDGRNTAGGEDYLKAADEANEANVPIFTVGVGDNSRERRLDVVGVYADDRVWRGDPFEIRTVIRAKDFTADSVNVQLWQRPAGQTEGGKLIKEETVAGLSGDAQKTVVGACLRRQSQ